MGLIQAIKESGKSVLADQWLEYFYCDTLSSDVLVQKANKVVKNGSNTKASDDIISNGSAFAVNEGQALLIVEDGKIIDFTVEAGRFTWDNSTEPSCFSGGFKGLINSFKTFGKRITTGGDTGKNQKAYYVNMKEIYDNKFGSQTPMPYHDPAYRGIYIRYFGQYTFKIVDPIVFFANVSGNVPVSYTKKQLMEQCDAEFVNAIDTALAMCSDEGYQYNDLPKKQREIAEFMNTTLDESWKQRRGLEIEAVALMKVTPDDESRQRMQKIDDSIMMGDSRVAAGRLADAQATAMENAAKNEAGAFTGFLGMGMAMQNGAPMTDAMFANAGGNMENNPLFAKSTMKSKEKESGWKCECGAVNTGKFCSECGKPQPKDETWTCECGAVNKGKFCSECGKPKPAGPKKCPQCGKEVEGKFCPECGTKVE